MFVIFVEAAFVINKHSWAFCAASAVFMTIEMASQLATLNLCDGKTCKGEIVTSDVSFRTDINTALCQPTLDATP